MDHIGYLTSLYDLNGRSAVDVGAGKGHFAKQLASHGAHVTGIEIDAEKVALAGARMPENVRIIQGRGEDLPLETGSRDLVCFMYSFHHIPIEVHERTIAEVIRVLKPDGRLHVAEPLAENCATDPMKLVDDETHVRTRSHARMQSLAKEGVFALVGSKQYTLTNIYGDFGKFVDGIIRVDPSRVEKLIGVRDEMERMFHEKAILEDGRFRIDNPCRAYHFQLD